MFKRFNACFPEPAEMWGRGRYEIPLYFVVSESILESGIICESMKTPLKFAVCALKVRTVVTVHVCRKPASTDESRECCEKAICRIIIDAFKVNRLSGETHEHCDVVFCRFLSTTHKRDEIHGTSVVHSSMRKGGRWIYSWVW